MTDEKKCNGCLSRRAAVGGGAKIGVFVAASGSALAVACGKETKEGGDAGQTVTADSSGLLTLDYTKYPELQNAGGSVRLNVNGTPLSVTRVSSNQVVAVRAVCTHEGGTLNGYSGNSFSCPLHGATFSANGTVTAGPARTNLLTYKITVLATGITVAVA